ncbi:MAG: hypothetical protein KF845_04720 [Cyclobacteriaceae bacterium]|nr:hypothetical protein [Cyclobacteriaceae bacterium]
MKRYITLLIISLLFSGCGKEMPDLGSRITLDGINIVCGVLPPGYYNAVRFTSPNIAYTITNNGKIYKTEDGGTSWTPQNSGTELPLYDMFFLDDLHGYVVGNNGVTNESIILKTDDGGNTWAAKNLQTQLYSMHFINNMTGYAVGQGLFKTQNGGETWDEIDIGYLSYGDLIFFDENIGFLTANVSITLERVVLKTTDGGIYWEKLSNVSLEHSTIRKIQIQEGIAYLVTNSGKMFKTPDIGNSWQTINTPLFNSSCFINEQQAIGVSQWWPNGFFSHGVIYITNDGGKSWKMKDFSPNHFFSLNDVDIFNDSIGLAVGHTSGCVIKLRF